MQAPKVSILMATYRRPEVLQGSIQSIREQTFTDWELIVVSDGDDDLKTNIAMKEWVARDERIKYFPMKHAGRIAIVSNFAAKRASGEYIAILDDDDLWADAEKLAKQVEFLDTHPDYVGCGSGFIMIDGAGREFGRALKPEHHEDIRANALIANGMANSATLFRKSAAEQVGWYDETMPQFADWDFWLKMGLIGKLYNFPAYFLSYRMWEQGMSFAKQKVNARCAVRIVKHYANKYPHSFRSLIFAYGYLFYTFVPEWARKLLNPFLSRAKKIIFSK
jgi:glycosyltransferase involved in cell wall biosynthesis